MSRRRPRVGAAARASGAKETFRERLERLLWTPPDPDLVHAGIRGEWMIASIRILIVLLIIYIPLTQFFTSNGERGRELMLWVAVAALAEALVVYSAVIRSWGRGWIGFFSGLLDVSLVTATLFIFLRIDRPLDAVNDLVIFPVYLLAIGATSLRYDWRISVLVGATAILQYAALVRYAVWQWDLDDPTLSPVLAAQFDWAPQIGRLVLLAMATMLATTLIQRAREQRTLSNRDRLTNLANRGFFDESLARIGALASRSGEAVTIAMIDVDHFKRFNDTYGHQAGDVALQTVSSVFGESFRNTDLVARYGGEEFAGLFPGMSLADALRRLEQLRRKIESLPIRIGGGRAVHVTVSIGVAVWPKDGLNLTEVLSLADQRLYQAKTQGRNRVVARPETFAATPTPAATPAPTFTPAPPTPPAAVPVAPPVSTPGAGTPGAGTPGAGTPGAGTPGAGTPGTSPAPVASPADSRRPGGGSGAAPSESPAALGGSHVGSTDPGRRGGS